MTGRSPSTRLWLQLPTPLMAAQPERRRGRLRDHPECVAARAECLCNWISRAGDDQHHPSSAIDVTRPETGDGVFLVGRLTVQGNRAPHNKRRSV